MIIMVGNHICRDCRAAMEVIERENLPVEFHDMEGDLGCVREFLKIREGNPELFGECKKENQIGIPVFVLEDGTVTLDTDKALDAARKGKAPVVTLIGSHLCKFCREAVTAARAEELPVEFHDIVENLNDMKLFLKIREENPELYEECRKDNRVGIPVYVLPDGTLTRNTGEALEAARKIKNS